jgi:hypothetical protein
MMRRRIRGQLFSQVGLCAMKSRHNGADGTFQRLADLLVVEAPESLKEQRKAHVVWKALDSSENLVIEALFQPAAAFLVHRVEFRDGQLGEILDLVKREQLRIARGLSDVVDPDITQNPK